MSRPSENPNEEKMHKNEDPDTDASGFSNTLTAAVTPETKLLSTFEKDAHACKVYLAGRGESAQLSSLITTAEGSISHSVMDPLDSVL